MKEGKTLSLDRELEYAHVLVSVQAIEYEKSANANVSPELPIV